MATDDERLEQLAGAILDGTTVDWTTAESDPALRISASSSISKRSRPSRPCNAFPTRGDISASSNASAAARSATSTARGIRASIAKSR